MNQESAGANERIVTIAGVLDACGSGGAGSTGSEEVWSLLFGLEVWRDPDGALRRTRLDVRQSVSATELRRLMSRLEPYSTVTLRVKLSAEESSAELVELIGGADSDRELLEFAQAAQEPVTLQDELFGTLTLEKDVDCFAGDALWGAQPIVVRLKLDEHDRVEAQLTCAKALWREQAAWDRRVRDFAIRELLPLKNDAWLEHGGEPLTPEQFAARMTLASIVVSADEALAFWYDDGNLFYGHSIQIRGDLAKGPTDCDLPG